PGCSGIANDPLRTDVIVPRVSTAGEGTGSSSRRNRQRSMRTGPRPRAIKKYITRKGSCETRMQQGPTDTKQRMPSSRVLEEVIRQASAEYVTVGWLTSTLRQHSF